MPDPSLKPPVNTGEKTISGRTIWNDPETGKDYSERSTTFEIDGNHYTMPTVSEDGMQYTDKQIRTYVIENGPIDYLTGEELPVFESQDDAIDYAIQRSSTRKQTDMAEGGAILMNNQMQQFAEGGLKDEGGMVDEVSGNEVPIGGTKEGVRDDIPANVSEGEFIFPADVVRFVGLDKLMSIRQDAKMGLRKMEDMGQMGNSDEATMPDDMPFGMADIMVIGDKGEPMEFANGGFVPSYAEGGLLDVATGTTEELETSYVPTSEVTEEIDYDAYMNSVTTVTKEYRNAAGESIVITFINGVPTLPIPDGYTLYNAEAGGGGAVSLAGQVVAQSNTSGRGSDNRQDRDRSPVIAPEPINYAGMSDEKFVAQMKTESSGLSQFGRALGFGLSAMAGGSLIVYGGMRSHARKAEDRFNDIINRASGAYKDELIAARDAFLKSYSLKPTDETNVIARAADSFLRSGKNYSQDQVDAAVNGVSSLSNTDILVDIEPGTVVPLTSYDPEKRGPRPEGTKIQPKSQSSTRARAIQLAEERFANSTLTKELAEQRLDNDIQKIMQDTNIPPGESGDNDEMAGKIVRENIIEKRFADGEIPAAFGATSEEIKNTAIKNLREQYQKPEYLGGDDLQGTQSFYNDAKRSGDVFEPLPEGAPTYDGSLNRLRNISTSSAPAKDIVFNKNLKNEMKTVGNLNSSGERITVGDAYISADKKTDAAVRPAALKRNAADKSPFSVLGDSRFDELVKAEPGSGNSYNNRRFAEARNIQKQADDYYQTGAGMDGYSIPQGMDKEYFAKLAADDEENYFDSIAAPLAPQGKGYIQSKVKVKTPKQLATTRKNQETNRRLRAEEDAANSRQNNAFQNAANELTPDDGKEYKKGILVSTEGKNEGDRINTAYQTAANLATPGDGNKYTGGILRNSKGEQINSAYQNAANALTTGDGRSYIKGRLMSDADPTMPYVASSSYIPSKDRSPTRDPNNPTGGKNTSAEAMAADMAAFKQKFGKAGNSTNEDTKSGYTAAQLAAAHQRNVAAGSATVNSYVAPVRDRDQSSTTSITSNNTTSNSGGSSSNSGGASKKVTSTKKAPPKKESYSQKIKRGGYGLNKGGLASKPKAKKKTTNKRGLAARK